MKINRTHLLNMFMFFLLLVVGIIFSVYMKNEFYWDFANYHYYNAFAFLNNRLNYDIVPASVNTFFNPLIDLPLYFYIQRFNDNANLIYALQGVWGGLMLFVFYKIYSLFFKTESLIDYVFLGLALILSVSGQATFYQIGASTNEIPIAFFVLWGLYVLLKMVKFPLLQKTWKFFVAGLIMGIGLGLKQTIITYCIASGLSLIICYKYLNRPLRSIFFFALGGLAGYLMINGYFMLKYWDLYQNPFFPFLNGIFHSPYFFDFNWSDNTFVPSLKIFLIYPFLWKTHPIGEIPYQDIRLPLCYIILWWNMFIILKKLISKQKNSNLFVLINIFLFLSFFLWMGVFSILRYAVVLEIGGSLLFIKILFDFDLIIKNKKALLCFFFLITFALSYYLSHIIRWGSSKDEAKIMVEKIRLPENTLLKIFGQPSSFIIPELSKYNHFQSITYFPLCMNQEGMNRPEHIFVEKTKFKQMRNQKEQRFHDKEIIVYAKNIIDLEKDKTELNKMNLKYKNMCQKAKEFNLISKDTECDKMTVFCEDETLEDITKDIQSNYFCKKLENNLNDNLIICVPQKLKFNVFGKV